MKGLAYDCCDRLVIGFDSNLPTVDEIMVFSACKCGRKQFFLDFCISSFSLPPLGLMRHRPQGNHPVSMQHQDHSLRHRQTA